MFAYKLDPKPRGSLSEQMYIISDCLMSLGYRDLAMLAQRSVNWEYVHDFINLIKVEAYNRKDDTMLDRLAQVWAIREMI